MPEDDIEAVADLPRLESLGSADPKDIKARPKFDSPPCLVQFSAPVHVVGAIASCWPHMPFIYC